MKKITDVGKPSPKPILDSAAPPPRQTGKGKALQKISELVPTESDLRHATTLLSLALKKGKVSPGKSSRLLWAKQICALVDLDGHERQRVDDVIDWYLNNTSREFMPRAFSGASIRNKFQSILDAFLIDNPFQGLVPSELALELSRDVWNLGWRRQELKEELPYICQGCLDFLADFTVKVQAKTEAPPCPPRGMDYEQEVCRYLLSVTRDQTYFILGYFSSVKEKYGSWPGWGGDLKKHALSPSCKKFREDVGQGSGEYFGQSGLHAFKKLMKEFYGD